MGCALIEMNSHQGIYELSRVIGRIGESIG